MKTIIIYFSFLSIAGASDCKPGGCSGQICTDKEGIMSTCQWKPEYECIKLQKCERQTDGKCGWTLTEESKRCLAKVKTTVPTNLDKPQ